MSFFEEHDLGCSPRKACRRCELYKLLQESVPSPVSREKIIESIGHHLAQARGEMLLPEAVAATTNTDWPEERRRFLEMSVKKLEQLSLRALNCLESDDTIHTVRDLVLNSESELLRILHFGRRSLNEVKEVLHQYNLHLGMIPGELPPEPPTE